MLCGTQLAVLRTLACRCGRAFRFAKRDLYLVRDPDAELLAIIGDVAVLLRRCGKLLLTADVAAMKGSDKSMEELLELLALLGGKSAMPCRSYYADGAVSVLSGTDGTCASEGAASEKDFYIGEVMKEVSVQTAKAQASVGAGDSAAHVVDAGTQAVSSGNSDKDGKGKATRTTGGFAAKAATGDAHYEQAPRLDKIDKNGKGKVRIKSAEVGVQTESFVKKPGDGAPLAAQADGAGGVGCFGDHAAQTAKEEKEDADGQLSSVPAAKCGMFVPLATVERECMEFEDFRSRAIQRDAELRNLARSCMRNHKELADEVQQQMEMKVRETKKKKVKR
eukprot:TRINITY_DN44055_c0_g1_i1.p1 TRINITY_DN44055_c0_g1~~TRINITY_DN44055_c0_g1_i1.p1  ORF type:complete len:335 (-),score=78.74 TRINITY_DN44055_c0_g1_i1:113-1117(-)